MKRLLIVLNLILGLNVTASHYKGGVISIEQKSYDSTRVVLSILHTASHGHVPTTYIDYFKIDCDSLENMGWVWVYLDTTIIHDGENFLIYKSSYQNFDSARYRFVWQNHANWGYLDNASNSRNIHFTLTTDYLHIPNNSLLSLDNPIPLDLEVNFLNTVTPLFGNSNSFFTQTDNDAVEITESGLYHSYNFETEVFTMYPYTPINVNILSNSINWTPNMVGVYGTGFDLIKIRNTEITGIQRMQWTFNVVNSTIGIEENQLDDLSYKVYDWNGRYIGENINWYKLKGLYVIRYSNGKIQKIKI